MRIVCRCGFGGLLPIGYMARSAFAWNGRTGSGRAAASGVYFCRLEAGGTVETKKVVLLR